MVFRGSVARICLLSLLALVCAASVGGVYGCGHNNLDDYETIRLGDDWEEGTDNRTVGASLSVAGIHKLDVQFDSSMGTSTVDVDLTDENGAAVQNVSHEWSDDLMTLHLSGPFKFCETYTATVRAGSEDSHGISLEQDLPLTATTGSNPYDIDGGQLCTAEIAISPLYTYDLDGGIFPGESISTLSPHQEFYRNDVDTSGNFYFDASSSYDEGYGMVMLPALSSSGRAGAAKLFMFRERNPQTNAIVSKDYWLDIWDEMDVLSESAAASITYSILGSSSRELLGPFDAGDLNGDGARDLLMSEAIPLANGGVLQSVHLIAGPVATMGDIDLESASGGGVIVGSSSDVLTPFKSVGDVDGDGFDDLAAIRYGILSSGGSSYWQIWLLHGDADIDGLLSNPRMEKIDAYPARKIVDVDAGDVDGDGISDLMIVEVQRRYVAGKYRDVKPRVLIFFGGQDFDSLSMVTPDSELDFGSNYHCEVGLRVLGDVTGDGLEDIGVGINEYDLLDRPMTSKIYLFAGRDPWSDGYYMDSNVVANSNLTINATDYGEIHWKDDLRDPKIGDINNDGYYDFKVEVEDGSDYFVYWFLGRNAYSSTGWKRDLDDASCRWTFSAE